MSQAPSEIAALIVPLSEYQMLLPNVSVAEVIPWQEFSQRESSPGDADAVLGSLSWRGVEVPLLSIEILQGADAPKLGSASAIAVLNSYTGDDKMPFFAIVTQGLPRLSRFGEEQLLEVKKDLQVGETAWVELNGETLLIPDLQSFEQSARQVQLS